MGTKASVALVQESQSIAESGLGTDNPSRPAWISGEVFPFRSRFIEIAGARLHYIDEGSGPTLLFLHGSPMWSFMFRHSISALRARFRCVALDMPGLGLSSAPLNPGHAFESNARYYRDFVRNLELTNFVAIAHATAGPPCLDMAIRERERIAGLVITNSFAWSMAEFPGMWRFVRIVSSRPFKIAAIYLNLLPRLTTKIARNTGKFSQTEKKAILGPYETKVARRHLANMLFGLRAEIPFFERLESDLNALQDIPVLLLYGAKDHGFQAGFLQRWQQLLPRNTVTILDDSAHFPQEDQPKAYTDALARWLDAQLVQRRVSAAGNRL